MENYSGTLRIKPQNFTKLDYKRLVSEINMVILFFNVGCGRFKTEKNACSACRTRTRPELLKVIEEILT
jgi:hypothetical protein